MKKLFFVLVLLLIPTIAFSGSTLSAGAALSAGAGDGVAAASTTCSRATQQPPTDCVTAAGSNALARNANQYLATKFVYGGTDNGSACSVDFYLSKTCAGTCTGDINAYIYSDSGGTPNASIVSFDAVAMGDVPTSAAWVTFSNGTGTALANGTTYWLVLYKLTQDADNYASVVYDSTAATESIYYKTTGAWTELSSTTANMFKLYILE